MIPLQNSWYARGDERPLTGCVLLRVGSFVSNTVILQVDDAQSGSV